MLSIEMLPASDLDEAMFDAGFGNVRCKVAKALQKHWVVTNVTKFMDNKSDCFMVIDKDDSSHFFKFISTGTGVKCPGYFTNASLSAAVNQILNTVENN